MKKLLRQLQQPLKRGALQKHMISTYFGLRSSLACIAIIFPTVLLLYSAFTSEPLFSMSALLPSMSDYYHTPIRDFFVGALVAVGAGLYAYKGINRFENVALNAAAVFVILAALIPTNELGTDLTITAVLHKAFAILFFLSLAAVCLTAKDRANQSGVTKHPNRFRMQYAIIGYAMIILPASAAVLPWLLKSALDSWVPYAPIFWVESAAIGVFAWYWILQTIEFSQVDLVACAGHDNGTDSSSEA